MTRRDLPTDAELEALLRDVGRRLAYPEPAALAARVRARIAAEPRPARRTPWALALAPAALTLVFLGAGAYAADAIRLRGAEIVRGPLPPAPAAPRIAGVAPVASLEEAARRAAFQPAVLAGLGRPDEIGVLAPAGGSPQVVLVYTPRPGLPASELTGVGALVTQVRATVELTLLSKIAGPDTRVERLTVRGAPAVWIEGRPHVLFYREPDGRIVQDTLRLAGNVLLWERDGLLLRLEAQVPRSEALRIAESAR